ncbi:MAG: glycoside hydrolase family 127 protein [Bacteroidota bacterium]|nr:glycoside hydrolase family 127 protein [Bacteroidota bacterium]
MAQHHRNKWHNITEISTWVGMYEGPYNFGPVQWSDFISVQNTISETAKNGFVTKVKFTNNRNAPFEGTIKYRVADKNNKELFTETKQVLIQPVKGFEYEVAFTNYQPVNEKIFKVGYQIIENNSTASISREQLYLADKQLQIEVASEPKPAVENKIKDVFTSIPFQNQQQRGYLGKRMTQNLEERLLKLDEEGTLDGYLQRPGHHPWAGEHIGKYLETASNVWRNTHDPRLKKQMDRMMYELVNSQMPDGYLGTYSPDEYWTSWDVWSHKYNLYGLLAYYKTTGYQPALQACKRMGDLLCATFGNNPGQRDLILAGTHVGMAATSVLDPMVELYKYTGEKKYLDFCYYILDAWEHDNGPKIFSSLLATGKVTKVGNGKAYEMLCNFVGLSNLYRVTGDEKLLKPVLIAWKDIVTNRLYITGTTSSHEYFQEDAVLPAGKKDNMGEGCVTTTWIQFNQQLLAVTGDFKYEEQIEKSIYNHLLGAENPETGCVSYYTPLMGNKPYTCNITCCQSSVPRGIAMVPYFTFGNVKNVPTLMMYEPASYKENITTADKKTINLSLQVESSFPENGNAVVTVSTSQIATFPLAFRVPAWSSSFTATVGGKAYQGIANQSLIIDRLWKSGEKIKVSFQMPVQVLAGGKSYPDQIAFQRGPQVLALDSLLNIEVLKKFRLSSDQKLVVEKPSGKSDTALLPSGWIGKQAYTVSITDKKSAASKPQLVLVPFADASQTGGALKVWMPLIIINK